MEVTLPLQVGEQTSIHQVILQTIQEGATRRNHGEQQLQIHNLEGQDIETNLQGQGQINLLGLQIEMVLKIDCIHLLEGSEIALVQVQVDKESTE